MSLKIQYASDLHLEFTDNKTFLNQHPLGPEANILVIAGDIVPFSAMDKHKDFFRYLSDHFETTYWLPGNHEYYHADLSQKCGIIKENICSNVFLVNNTAVLHGTVKLVFSTLWSKISLANQGQIERSMNDFHLINYKGYRFSTEQYNQLHDECLSFIQSELTMGGAQKTAVFTHHAPTFLNYPEQYKGDVLNEAFAVELFNLIEDSAISYWGYGHHHCNTPDFKIGNTMLITNQLGYVLRNEHALFSTNKFVII